MVNPDALYSANRIIVCANLAACTAAFVTMGGVPTRAIRAGADGTVTVNSAGGDAGQAMPFKAGERQDVQVTAITALTGAAPVTLFW
jgi:hypothetical protein